MSLAPSDCDPFCDPIVRIVAGGLGGLFLLFAVAMVGKFVCATMELWNDFRIDLERRRRAKAQDVESRD